MIQLEHVLGSPLHERFAAAVKQLKPGDLTIDCGANFGTITGKFRSRGCVVHAFEPDPIALRNLHKLFRDDALVTIHETAVGISDGWSKLYFHPGRNDSDIHTQSSSVMSDKSNISTSLFEKVKVTNFPRFLETLPQRVSVLKIDIEGAEAELLIELIDRGLYSKFDCAFVETHETKIPSTQEPMKKVREEIARLGLTHIFLDWK